MNEPYESDFDPGGVNALVFAFLKDADHIRS